VGRGYNIEWGVRQLLFLANHNREKQNPVELLLIGLGGSGGSYFKGFPHCGKKDRKKGLQAYLTGKEKNFRDEKNSHQNNETPDCFFRETGGGKKEGKSGGLVIKKWLAQR